MVYKHFRYLVTSFSDKTPHIFISQWEETYKYRIKDGASQAQLQHCEAIFNKPESSLYLLSNNVRVYKLYSAKIENRLVWEALEPKLITWEVSHCPFIFHSPSHGFKGKGRLDRLMLLEDVNCKAFAWSSKTKENRRETCTCHEISILLS